MNRSAFDQALKEANRMLLTPYERLGAKERKIWRRGMKRMLEELQRPTSCVRPQNRP